LIALIKKSGGIRPIAIGNVLRRLATKIILFRNSARLGQLLRPRQVGYATPNGAERAVHSARTYLEANDKCVLLKIDFRNAFNENRRDRMLHLVNEHVPDLYPLMHNCYSDARPLLFGEKVIWSESGCQQGDVAGPALFSLQIKELADGNQSDLSVFFLDDETCADVSYDKVLADAKRAMDYEAISGLVVNSSKCELYVKGSSPEEQIRIEDQFRMVMPDIQIVTGANLELLGAGLTVESTRKPLEKILNKVEVLCDRLKLLSPHPAFFLLKNSLGVQRVIYAMRTSPSFLCTDTLERFDETYRSAVENLLSMSVNNNAWLQCSLPTRKGGLGLRLTTQLALPAFLSSYYSTKPAWEDLVDTAFVSPCIEEGLEKWDDANNGTRPPLDDYHIQSAWDNIQSDLVSKALNEAEGLPEEDHIRLTNVASKDSSYWLQAIPARQLGTNLDDYHFRLAVGLRLGLPLFPQYNCRCKDRFLVDVFGRHPLSCKASAQSRQKRHYFINDIVRRVLGQAGFTCTMEPPHLAVGDDKRPDGLTNLPWWRGKHLVWDVTVADSYARSYRNAAVGEAGSVAQLAEARKNARYVDLLDEYVFVPLAFETTGKFGPDALALTKRIGRAIAARTGDDRATSFIRQRISVEIQRGNAQALMETFPDSGTVQEAVQMNGVNP
jgi:hypothetical protein